jgi:adenylate kinase
MCSYNLANIQNGDMVMPPLLPKKEGICDKCSGPLIQRADDTEAVVKNRLEIYNKQTSPLINFYQKQGLIKTFNIKKGMGDLPELVKLFETFGKK